jgi:hypothetical protein
MHYTISCKIKRKGENMAGCSKQIFVWNTLLRVLPPGRDIVKHILWGVIRVFLSLLSLLLR